MNEENNQEIKHKSDGKENLGERVRDSYDLGQLTRAYVEMGANHILNTNPSKVILGDFDKYPDNIKKVVLERIQPSFIVWMDSFDNYLKAGASLPADLIGFVADIARKNRNEIK